MRFNTELPIVAATETGPVTHADAVTRLRAYAAESRRVFPIKRADGTRDPRHLSVGQEKKVLSYFGRALCAAGVAPSATECVRVLVPDLAALASTRAIHGDAPGAVRIALELLFGYRGLRRAQLPGHTRERLLPTAYRPLLNYVQSTDTFAKQAANLLTVVARTARAAGATDAPREMPSAAALIAASRQLHGIAPSRLGRALSVYRRLMERAIAADPNAAFAPVPDGRVERAGGRGLLSTMGRLARDGHPRANEFLRLVTAADGRMALRAIFPRLAEDLEAYLDNPRAARKRAHDGQHLRCTQHDVIVGVCNAAATLIEERFDVTHPDLDLEWVWSAQLRVQATTGARNSKMRRRAAERATNGDATDQLEIPVSRWLADRLAMRARPLSPTESMTGYPDSVVHDLWALWAVTVAVYEEDLAELEPELWIKMRAAWDTLRVRFTTRRASVPEGKRKQKVRGVSALPAPYLYGLGLPLLAMKARRELQRARHFIARAAALNPTVPWAENRDARLAVDKFATASLEYLVLALTLWDSLRENNYTFALYGLHVRAVSLYDGSQVINTNWTDDPDDRARCKQSKRRSWNLPCGAIDLAVWDGYLELVRAPRLMRRGVSAEDAVAQNGRFALFVTDRPSNDPTAPLSASQISRVLFGGGLLWIARNVFGIAGLPDTADKIDRVAWHGVFSSHFARDEKATALGVVMGEWAAAEEHTLDEQRTLRQHYAQSVYGATLDAAGWNVSAWMPWMTRAMLGSGRVAQDALADTTLRALLPAAAKETLREWQDEDRARGARGRGTAAGVPAGRTRRRRPGQPPPISPGRD